MAEFLNLFMALLHYLSMSFILCSNCFVLCTLWVLSQRRNKPLRKPDKVCLKLTNNLQIIYTPNFYVHKIGKKSWESLHYTGNTTGRWLPKSIFHTEVHVICGGNSLQAVAELGSLSLSSLGSSPPCPSMTIQVGQVLEQPVGKGVPAQLRTVLGFWLCPGHT